MLSEYFKFITNSLNYKSKKRIKVRQKKISPPERISESKNKNANKDTGDEQQ